MVVEFIADAKIQEILTADSGNGEDGFGAAKIQMVDVPPVLCTADPVRRQCYIERSRVILESGGNQILNSRSINCRPA